MSFHLGQVVGAVQRRLAPSGDYTDTGAEGKNRLDVLKSAIRYASGGGDGATGPVFQRKFWDKMGGKGEGGGRVGGEKRKERRKERRNAKEEHGTWTRTK